MPSKLQKRAKPQTRSKPTSARSTASRKVFSAPKKGSLSRVVIRKSVVKAIQARKK